MNKPLVYVVIPFYQRVKQPLIRALASIAAQKFVATPQVLIVDDESPCPAISVIEEYFAGVPNLHVVKQKNAGASSARNTALNLVPDDADYVAFLDSDDEWMPDHLFNALLVLESDCDLYFGDHQRTDWNETKFSMIGFQPALHELLRSGELLYRYEGDPLLPILRDHLIQTSSVVLRWKTVSTLRFRSDLVLGEDELYWIEAIRRMKNIGFSAGVSVKMGQGVNISQNSDRNCVREAELIAKNVYFWSRLPNYLPHEKGIEELRSERIGHLSQTYASVVIECIKAGRMLSPKNMLMSTLTIPRWILYFVRQLYYFLISKLRAVKLHNDD